MPRISAERSRAQRDRIVAGAIQVFAEHGYATASVDAVCLACGLSKGALYTYFASKEELFIAASEHVFELRYRTVAEAVAAGQRGSGGTDALVTAFTGTLLHTDGAFLRLWVEGFLLAAAIPRLAELKRDYHGRFGALLEQALRQASLPAAAAGDPTPNPAGPGAGLGSTLDVAATAECVMAMADGLMLYTLVPGLGPDADRVTRLLTGPTAPVSSWIRR